MGQFKLKNNIKKGQGNILLSIFFIIIVLIVIFLFTKYHEVILISNYNMNDYKMQTTTLYSLKEELTSCYGYPLKITSLNDCNSISDLNFQIKTINNGLCQENIIIQNGQETSQELNLFVPVVDTNNNVCPAQIHLYFEEK